MAESVLVNRKKFISSLDNKLVEPLNALSKKTRVPKSRLLDEAIEDLLKKMKKRTADSSAVLFRFPAFCVGADAPGRPLLHLLACAFTAQ